MVLRILISFVDAAAVVSKTLHSVYGMTLHAHFAPASSSKSIHPQFYTDRLLVSGIPPGVDKEFFVLFFEKFTGINEETCDIQEPLDGSTTVLFKEEQSESSKYLKLSY